MTTSILLIPYFIFIALYVVIATFAIYKVWQFGFTGDATKFMLVFFGIAVGVTMFFSWVAISTVSWQTPLPFLR